MKISRSITVSGKVQGVWFRASAQRKAFELGLTGFVSNQPDGNVYIEVSGTPDQLERFVEWCRQGPELAKGEDIFLREIPLQQHISFEIRR